jgi:hypothetical protein
MHRCGTFSRALAWRVVVWAFFTFSSPQGLQVIEEGLNNSGYKG